VLEKPLKLSVAEEELEIDILPLKTQMKLENEVPFRKQRNSHKTIIG